MQKTMGRLQNNSDIVGFIDSGRKMIYVRTPGSLQGAE